MQQRRITVPLIAGGYGYVAISQIQAVVALTNSQSRIYLGAGAIDVALAAEQVLALIDQAGGDANNAPAPGDANNAPSV